MKEVHIEILEEEMKRRKAEKRRRSPFPLAERKKSNQEKRFRSKLGHQARRCIDLEEVLNM